MMQQDPLAALHPLREPDAIGWWPLAPGWWLLAVLLVAVIMVAVVWLYRRHRASEYRRLGCRQLDQLHSSYKKEGDTRAFLTAGNALLKSVALQAYPAHLVASSHGDRWTNFLNDSTSGNKKFDPVFTAAIYAPDDARIDAEAFYQAAQHWIKHHRKESGNSTSMGASQ